VAVVLGVVVALVAGGFGIYFASKSLDKSNSTLNRELPAQQTANRLLADVVNQETGERGYVITGNPSFLQPYASGRARSPLEFASLRRNVANDPIAVRDLATVQSRYQEWLTSFADPQIDDVQSGQVAVAIEAEKTGTGKHLFDNVRESLATLSSRIALDQRNLVSESRGLQEDTLWLIVAVTTAALIGAVVALLFLNGTVTRPIRQLENEVRTVGEGDVDHEIEVGGPPEITALARSVEAMRVTVGQQADELRLQRNLAEAFQQSLLPKVLPIPRGFDVVARYLPGAVGVDVGGDWYNVRTTADDQLFFAVGDVSGRGIRAASVMASHRYAINAYIVEEPDPGDVLTRLSRLIGVNTEEAFATVLCGLFDDRNGTLTLASAGHPPAIRSGSRGAYIIEVEPGPPIGLGVTRFRTTCVPVEPGTMVLAYTDGLIERRDESVDDSVERLRRAVRTDQALSAVVDGVITSLIPGGSHDDVVVLGMQWQSDLA
jgi:CHASE3 domain sensor protein